ncbi:MAG: hypothetical protein ABW199_09045 [Caulobacterales bacterium]
MMRALIFVAALALAGCGRDAPETIETPVGVATPLPHVLPPPGNAPRFIGLWAASEEGCSASAWRITQDRLTTPGHIVCDFTNVREAPGGYNVAAECTAEGPKLSYNLELRFAESAQSMMISGGPMEDIGLVYCAAPQTAQNG